MKKTSEIIGEKPKKKFKWWYVLIAIVVLGGIGSAFGGGDKTPPATTPASSDSVAASGEEAAPVVTEETAPVVTEESKQAAKDVDAEIFAICSVAENDYKTFVNIVSADSASDLDAYNTAKTLKSNLEYYNYTQLSAVNGDGIKDYKESASLYLYTMADVADNAMEYLDDPITSKLSKFQDSIGTVETYLYDVVAKRLVFLSDAGLSADEIDAATSSSTSEAAS